MTDTVRRERFGKALRNLRENAKLTGTTLGKHLGIAQSTVSRWEAGERLPTPDQIDRWAAETGATDAQRNGLHQLAAAAATEVVTWGGRTLASMQRDTANLEESSGLIRGYHPLLVHSLLQTRSYALAAYRSRAVIDGRTEAEITKGVTERLAKQAILTVPGHHFEFLMAEAGLRWRFVSRDIMVPQLERIAQVAGMPNVLIGILPMDVEVPIWRWGGFSAFLERADGDDLVLVESLASGTTEEGPGDLALYERAWVQLLAYAMTGEEAAALLERIAADLHG